VHPSAVAATPEPPAVVTLDVWGVTPVRLPAALLRMARDRRPLGRVPGLRFARLLGTGDGRSFSLRDADPLHWALLAAWDSAGAAERFDASGPGRGWARLSTERLRVRMRPLASRGRWAGQAPFGDPAPAAAYAGPGPAADDGPVAALTRARLAPRHALTFRRAVPPVAGALHGAAGLRLALGVGEAPVGLQGTFSLWESTAAMSAFVGAPAHRDAVRRTPVVGWYREELFARFAVLTVEGTYRDRAP
jgi:hypothetical protein